MRAAARAHAGAGDLDGLRQAFACRPGEQAVFEGDLNEVAGGGLRAKSNETSSIRPAAIRENVIWIAAALSAKFTLLAVSARLKTAIKLLLL